MTFSLPICANDIFRRGGGKKEGRFSYACFVCLYHNLTLSRFAFFVYLIWGRDLRERGRGLISRGVQSLILLHVTLLGVTVDDVGTVDVSVGVAV